MLWRKTSACILMSQFEKDPHSTWPFLGKQENKWHNGEELVSHGLHTALSSVLLSCPLSAQHFCFEAWCYHMWGAGVVPWILCALLIASGSEIHIHGEVVPGMRLPHQHLQFMHYAKCLLQSNAETAENEFSAKCTLRVIYTDCSVSCFN